WGGQIETTEEDGFLIERGGEGFVARSEALPALARELGMPDALIGQAIFGSYGFDGATLSLLSPGEAAQFLGFQVPPEDRGKGIRSLKRGMGSLIDALRAALRGRAQLIASQPVQRVELGTRVRAYTNDATYEADALIVATSAASASALLAPLVG